jgi:hypothetical protein
VFGAVTDSAKCVGARRSCCKSQLIILTNA